LISATLPAICEGLCSSSQGPVMPNNVFKKVELVGTSPASISDAINNAIATASDTLSNVSWFEVQEVRGHVEDGKVSQYQVVVKVGFRIDK
jgi:flavin-binding protein dodecin